MFREYRFPVIALLLSMAFTPLFAQPSTDRAAAMAKLGFMRGIWAGPATGIGNDGKPFTKWQVERMGPMLSGDIVVLEGRGYEKDGSTSFNAFGVVSWNGQTGKYELRSYAQGFAGTFEIKPTGDGYVWEIPIPDGVLRYTATVKDGRWREIGERIVAGKDPAQTFEMNLKRVADTDWPLGTVPPPSTGR